MGFDGKKVRSPAVDWSIEVNNQCSEANQELREHFQTHTAKSSIICEHGMSDWQTLVEPLTTKVKETDKDDFKKSNKDQ